MTPIERFLPLLIFAVTAVGTVGCSRSSAPPPTETGPMVRQLSVAELSALYDPSSLVEVKTLSGFPADLQLALGVHATDFPRIADVGEPCAPSDVVSKDYPDRCFLIGGVSSTSALLAYRAGGYAGPFVVAARYVRAHSGWTMISHDTIGEPGSLAELKEMSRLAEESNSARKE